MILFRTNQFVYEPEGIWQRRKFGDFGAGYHRYFLYLKLVYLIIKGRGVIMAFYYFFKG